MLYFAYAYAATLVLNLLLQVFGLVDMFQLVLLTHSLMALNMIVAVYVVHVELRIEKNKDLRMFIVPLALVSAGGLLEMILYYYSNMTQTSFALRIAVVAFLVVIIINAIKSYYDNLLELKQAEYYEQLASVDMLTNLGNRNKYEQFLQSHEPNQPLTAVLFDLNYLKYINDNFGHVVG
ncbi:MAG TPA: diguanylate cyclase, partial [Clostridia bacterium]|nr:diguanylate cyclase [Clostridia bacterium]